MYHSVNTVSLILCYHFVFVMIVKSVGFEVLTAVSTKMSVFWVVAPCSLVEVYQRFRGPCGLHYRPDELHGATTQKTTIFDSKPVQKLNSARFLYHLTLVP
jgi:hypothetical protein